MLEDIRNFLRLSPTLLSSGMPTAGQIGDIARAGVQLVINLAPFDPSTDLPDEATLVRSRGMEYINIPVEWDAPTTQDLEAFMSTMDKNRDRKILVHCRANYRATGFVSLYRILRLGWEPEKAFRDLRQVWDPEEYPVWKKYIAENLSRPRTA